MRKIDVKKYVDFDVDSRFVKIEKIRKINIFKID